VSHEVNNPLTVLKLRLAWLLKHMPADPETADSLQVALQAADEIHQVTVQLRSIVRPVSTHYLATDTRMLDLKASVEPGEDDRDHEGEGSAREGPFESGRFRTAAAIDNARSKDPGAK
jgi:signal transduction histidine kinase